MDKRVENNFLGRREKMKKALLLALMAGISIALIRIDLSSWFPCPEPDIDKICFNDSQCEAEFVDEYKYAFSSDPQYAGCEIDVFVWAACPFGVCESGMCTNYYNIEVSIYCPITGELYGFYYYNRPCETFPCY